MKPTTEPECCLDPGAWWRSTPCTCQCHYPNSPAWTLLPDVEEMRPHRHRDVGGRCGICGAER